MEVNGWKPCFEELPEREIKSILSSVEVPKLELEQLLRGLKYAFFISSDTFPVVITSKLTMEQEDGLIMLVKKYKVAIGWTMVDIKGISPLICTHKNDIENDSKTTGDQQHKLNTAMKEVVKNEILKFLDVGITYPIADDKRVSLMQVVPEKSEVMVVKNANNELVPTKLVTGWQMCLDNRKLSASTVKYHYPLPFTNQILERVDGNEFY